MRTTSILAYTLLFGAILSASIAVAQSPPGDAASDDIFELLTPLAEGLSDVEIDAAPTPALEPTPAIRSTPSLEVDSARRVDRGVGGANQEADASRSPSIPSPPEQSRGLTQQVRLLLEPAPSASENGDSPSRPPLLVEKPGLLTRLSQDELRTLLAQAAKGCQRDLEGIQYGQRWLKFLNLEQLQQHLAAPANVAAIEPIRKRFLAVTSDDQYLVITSRPSFQAVNVALNEYVAPAEDRRRRREAFDSLQELNAALRPAATGPQWLAFFKLADLERLLALPGERAASDTMQLKVILTRFQQAAEQPQFKTVIALPGFADTHRHLQQALVSLDQPDDETPQAQFSGKPLPEGVGSLLRLVDVQGECFHRPPQGDEWAAVEQIQAISSGTGIRTADGATARLLVGDHSKLLIAPGATFSVRQYIDDSNRIVTAIDAIDGKLSLLVDGESQSGESAPPDKSPFAGERIVIGAHDYRVVAGESRLALQFRVADDERRAFAAVYTGKAEVGNVKTGDRVLLQAGREAVLVPQGIALRAAGDGPAASTASRPSDTQRQ